MFCERAQELALHLVSTICLFLLASKDWRHYFKAHYLDQTFKGLYKPNAFDLALLIPYFIVLVWLASYGVHRYALVYMYYKNRNKNVSLPPALFQELPRVTVQLPVFNERFVVERLVEAVCRLQYTREKLDIQLLDDSTDDTQQVARASQFAAPRPSQKPGDEYTIGLRP